MFTLSRKLIATVAAASVLGVFSTTVVPHLSGDGSLAQAAKKKTKKKAKVRTAQS